MKNKAFHMYTGMWSEYICSGADLTYAVRRGTSVCKTLLDAPF